MFGGYYMVILIVELSYSEAKAMAAILRRAGDIMFLGLLLTVALGLS